VNLSDIEASLPWGLHDAYLESLALHWPKATLAMTVRVMMTKHQDMDQRASILVTGLVFCSIDAPEIDPERGYEPTPIEGLWIDSGTGPATPEAASRLPNVPDGCFLHWFFVSQWNRFIHICGRHAELTWIEAAPVAARGDTRALFPGENVP
jgi:hypothetical protein